MVTLTLTAEQANTVYNALREALDVALDRANDIETFPEEFETEDAESVQQEIAQLEELLTKLA